MNKIRINLMLDEETEEMRKILMNKHHINISSLIRDFIKSTYMNLEKVQQNERNKKNKNMDT